jgi:hypothetical protein
MKRILLFTIALLGSLSVLSQKVEVQLTRSRNASVSEWQILDEKYMPVLKESEYPVEDTINFSLEAGKRYFFLISISRISITDTCLYSLLLDNNLILLINSDTGTGDHFFPFFTGVKTDAEAKITGGSNASISDFPWQVFLEADVFTCGGSIISNQWIITAAHCTRDEYNVRIPASAMDVIVGANNPRNSQQGKKYLVSEVIQHEAFDVSTLENDIALLKLMEPINYPNAVPIKLISEKDAAAGATDPGVMSWVTGYGYTSVNPVIYPSTLQKVQLPIVSNAQASLVWNGQIAATDIMAGYRDGNKDACSGDSGGPMVVSVNGENKLAGLVSWGSSNCNTYGAYTRLSMFESWITRKTGIEITFIAPIPSGDSIVCYGTSNSEYLAAPVAGASSYNWSLTPQSAGSISGNSGTAIVEWNTGFKGPAKVNLQITRNGELSDISTLRVNVAKLTKIISEPADSVMCAEKPIALTIEAEGYNLNYSWFKNRNLLRSGPSGVVSILSAMTDDSGQYFCEINGSCGSVVSGTSNLTVLPVTRINTISPDAEVSFGEDLTLDVTTEGHNLTYQWQKDDNTIERGNSSNLVLQNVNANDIGLYRTTVSGTCGTQLSDKVYVYVKKEDYSGEPELFVWPTMVNEEFNVALSNDKSYTILLRNSIGRLLKVKENCQYQTILNISDLPPGIYIATIYNDTMRKSIKIIKK